MDDLALRYERLVAAWMQHGAIDERLEAVADEARGFAAAAEPTWYRVQAGALASAADAVMGRRIDLESVIDAHLPPVDEGAPARLGDLIAGAGSLADRLATHRGVTSVNRDILPRIMSPLLAVLRGRAQDDLQLSASVRTLEIAIVSHHPPSRWYRIDRGGGADRLILNGTLSWTAGSVVRVAGAAVMRHLAGMLRPPRAEWLPSPQGTVDRGLEALGREVLLGDHELAHELGRIGRAAGLRWSGERIVAVERAIDEVAPALAATAVAERQDTGNLELLGMPPRRADALLERWRDPLKRADCLSEAAGPPLVRAWLVRMGQTAGLVRLLHEWIVPTELREVADGPT